MDWMKDNGHLDGHPTAPVKYYGDKMDVRVGGDTGSSA